MNKLILAAMTSISVGCAGPKSLSNSGRVTPVGEIRMQAEMVNHTPFGTLENLGDGLMDAVSYLDQESELLFEYDDSINTAASGAISYFVDPVIPIGSGFGIRYGLYDRIDVGYTNAMGTHVADIQYQLLGEPGQAARNGSGSGSPVYASLGLKFSTQSHGLPSFASLDSLDELLGFAVSRTDLQVPLTVSIPFGPDEKFGALSMSAVYNRTMMQLEFNPNDTIVELLEAEQAVGELKTAIEHSATFDSYGASISVKGGYQYIYAGAGIGLHYSDYGTFPLFLDETIALSGITLVPNVFVEGRY